MIWVRTRFELKFDDPFHYTFPPLLSFKRWQACIENSNLKSSSKWKEKFIREEFKDKVLDFRYGYKEEAGKK